MMSAHAIGIVRAALCATAFAWAALAAPAQAQAPPSPPATGPSAEKQAPPEPHAEAPTTLEQRSALLATLYGRLAAAQSAEEAEPVTQAIERLWAYSGSPTADLLAERAATATQSSRHDLALKLLDATIDLQPDFAAAWSQRAYVYYLKNDYKRALGDLRRVLALDPNHYRALEGLAQILAEIGEKKAALEAYKKLLAVHPFAAGARASFEELNREVEGQGI